jgi:hypothetical protein
VVNANVARSAVGVGVGVGVAEAVDDGLEVAAGDVEPDAELPGADWAQPARASTAATPTAAHAVPRLSRREDP